MLLEKAGRAPAAAIAEPALEAVQHVGEPRAARLDDAEAEPRELRGDVVGDQVAEGDERQHARLRHARVPGDVEDLRSRRAAATGVNTDWHVEGAGLFVERE